MPSPQLKIVVDLLRSAPAVAGTDMLAMRKNMEMMTAAVPVPDLALTGGTLKTKAAEDPMVRAADLKQADACLAGRDPKTPLASPLYADLTGLPPLLIQVGSAEILLDDAVRVAERAIKAGVATELRVWPDMIHVWHAFADLLPEGQQAVDEMAAFLENRLA